MHPYGVKCTVWEIEPFYFSAYLDNLKVDLIVLSLGGKCRENCLFSKLFLLVNYTIIKVVSKGNF